MWAGPDTDPSGSGTSADLERRTPSAAAWWARGDPQFRARAQAHGRRLLHQQCVRTAVDHKAVDGIGDDDPPGACALLEQRGRRPQLPGQQPACQRRMTAVMTGRCPGRSVDRPRGTSGIGAGAVLAVHEPRERLDVLNRRRWQDAVAEIEDMAGPASGAASAPRGAAEQPLARTEQ